MSPLISRFAPSPTGDLHLGHAYSAFCAWQAAGASSTHFKLRIDDLDFTRCKTDFIDRQIEDLKWLGLSWDEPPLYQSQNLSRYQEALAELKDRGLIYPCLLTRAEVRNLLSAPQADGSLRDALSNQEKEKRLDEGTTPAWRLDMAKIKDLTPELTWHDDNYGTYKVYLDKIGDAIIARRDIGTSYHLSVVFDDADSDIDIIVRGRDLIPETAIHRLLQFLFDLPTPRYAHHALIVDDRGKRLAKRDDARAIRSFREAGYSPTELFDLCEKSKE